MPNSSDLSDPGYTPSRKDLATVLDWLLSGDEATAKLAERALVRAGMTSIELGVERRVAANAEQRVRLARLFGRLAQGISDARLDEALLAMLTDPQARVARVAAVAIGKLPQARAQQFGAEAALTEQLARHTGAERRAIIEALGKIGGGAALTVLGNIVAESELETQLLERARMRLGRAQVAKSDADTILLDVALARPCTVALFHRRGLSEIIGRQLRGLGNTVVTGQDCRLLHHYAGSIARLLQARSLLVPAIVVEIVRPRDESSWATAVVDAITQNWVLDLLERTTSTRPRLRFTLPREGHQRALLWGISEQLAQRTSRIDANPKAALWEVQLERGRDAQLLLIPKHFDDPRFGYRVREISGASHPTIAAALADLLEPTERDVIWDPFVGSGLELIECARLGRYRELIGTDNNARSLEAAAANVQSAKIERVRLLNADARTARLNGVTAIITNPPLGIRHQRDGQLGPLLLDFLTNARASLGAAGRLVWLSPLPQQTARHAHSLGFAVERLGPVDVGGLSPELQVLRLARSR